MLTWRFQAGARQQLPSDLVPVVAHHAVTHLPPIPSEVDDATNPLRAQFFEAESPPASYDVVTDWVRQLGLPGSLHVDRDGS